MEDLIGKKKAHGSNLSNGSLFSGIKQKKSEDHYHQFWAEWRKMERQFFTSSMNTAETPSKESDGESVFAQASELKQEGRNCYNQKLYNEAIGKYKLALEILSSPSIEETSHTQEIKQNLLISLCTSYYKLNDLESTIKTCEEGLNSFPNNFKLRYYCGLALLEQHNIDKALLMLKQARKLNPSNKEIFDKLQQAMNMKSETPKLTNEVILPPPVVHKSYINRKVILKIVSVLGVGLFLYLLYRRVRARLNY